MPSTPPTSATFKATLLPLPHPFSGMVGLEQNKTKKKKWSDVHISVILMNFVGFELQNADF